MRSPDAQQVDAHTPPRATRIPTSAAVSAAATITHPKVAVDSSGCWLWRGGITGAGYGVVGKDGRAERVIYRVEGEPGVEIVEDA